MDASRYPLDFEKLKRGDSLSSSQIESALGISRSDEDYPWKLLALRDQVVGHFLENGDPGVIVTTRDMGLQILTEEQAAHYVQKRDRQGRRMVAWSVAKASLIDRAQLTDATRKAHDDFVIRASWRLQQMRKKMPQIGGGDG